LFEIAHYAKPCIIVPIPEDVSRDQRRNAYAYARTGAATVVEEANLSQHLLVEEINTIINDLNKQQTMGAAAKKMSFPDAAPKIATLLLSIGHEHDRES
jgi:UDP-N-acetylglucosamine--N-acetylmuramyl-(pentapeptide) pyrophosphoryl-undecaprenol N-acetylglucosamine transferase